MEDGIVVSKLDGRVKPGHDGASLLHLQHIAERKAEQEDHHAENSFWTALAVETALGTIATGFGPP